MNDLGTMITRARIESLTRNVQISTPSVSSMVRYAKMNNIVIEDVGLFMECDGEVIQFPVNPEELSVSYSGNSETKEMIKLGEISILKGRKLSEISFESFFPGNTWFPAIRTKGDFKGPEFYKEWIEDKQKNNRYVRFIVTGLRPDVNTLVSIETFEYSHKAAEEEDMYYSLKLKEYTVYGITEIPVDDAFKRGGTSTKSKKKGTTTKTVKPTSLTVGCTVIVNGNYWYDSWGANPHGTFKNFKGKISHIVSKPQSSQKYPYHITTMDGGWRGWVSKSQITLAT